jgi:hypothetical protein
VRGGAVATNPGEECGDWLGGREREEEEIKRGDGVRVGLYRRARPCRREGERGSSHGAGLRTAGGAGVPFRCVAAARHRLLDVAERGTASGAARAVGGVVGRRVEQDKGDTDLQGLGRRPAVEIARAAESRGDWGLRKTMEDLGAISQKCRDLTIMLG